ncbi:hypothetical protein [Halomonas denitrificans]|uniref:hypothetical protein n=1 Tax=Halomonas denitrificans TaxID=370769 RepID=UPI00130036FC|nr:hypothetical protein [Halomonas denitrificans]
MTDYNETEDFTFQDSSINKCDVNSKLSLRGIAKAGISVVEGVQHPKDMPHLEATMDPWKFQKLEEGFEEVLVEDSSINKCDVNSVRPKKRRGRPAKRIENTVIQHHQGYRKLEQYPSGVVDVIEGFARLDHYDRGPAPVCPYKHDDPRRKAWLVSLWEEYNNADSLSVGKLVWCLSTLVYFSTTNIMDCFKVEKRQAQRYVKTLELMLPHLEVAWKSHTDEFGGFIDDEEIVEVVLENKGEFHHIHLWSEVVVDPEAFSRGGTETFLEDEEKGRLKAKFLGVPPIEDFDPEEFIKSELGLDDLPEKPNAMDFIGKHGAPLPGSWPDVLMGLYQETGNSQKDKAA